MESEGHVAMSCTVFKTLVPVGSTSTAKLGAMDPFLSFFLHSDGRPAGMEYSAVFHSRELLYL